MKSITLVDDLTPRLSLFIPSGAVPTGTSLLAIGPTFKRDGERATSIGLYASTDSLMVCQKVEKEDGSSFYQHVDYFLPADLEVAIRQFAKRVDEHARLVPALIYQQERSV
jgi:hypothetical protein